MNVKIGLQTNFADGDARYEITINGHHIATITLGGLCGEKFKVIGIYDDPIFALRACAMAFEEFDKRDSLAGFEIEVPYESL